MNTNAAIEVLTVREILQDQAAAIATKDARIEKLEKAMREAIKFMNGGAYGMAAVTLSAALDPPTSG